MIPEGAYSFRDAEMTIVHNPAEMPPGGDYDKVEEFLAVAFFYPLIRILGLTFSPQALTWENMQLAGHVLFFTFYQAAISTLLTLLLGLPAAYLFARYDFRGKSLLRALTIVPFMLPTVVVAAGFSALLGPRGVVHALLPSLAFNFMGTLTAILVAHVFYNTAIVIRVVGNAISSLDPRLDAAARSLGADPMRIWWHVTLPLLRPAILASALLVFLFDFTSFGALHRVPHARPLDNIPPNCPASLSG